MGKIISCKKKYSKRLNKTKGKKYLVSDFFPGNILMLFLFKRKVWTTVALEVMVKKLPYLIQI